ncbi:class I SAM-dependent rRNA methyltransferase [Anaerotruncus rubiinfantis]|uniref:class I SAM-dependent rRNA methyltransferase n=1 Tax=Anaerotruncus rubiinfantis TaxID=1720200 RepID=UPI0034A2D138
MKERNFPQAQITRKGQNALEGGHPWVYDTEVAKLSGPYENGGLVDVVSDKGRYLGTGLLSEKSKIRIRLISRNANDRFDEVFWERRFHYAWEYRKAVMGEQDLSCCRVIFGEADQFPGLTVDRFGDVLVTQTLSLGIERLKPVLLPALYRVLTADGQAVRGIYERNDVAIRELEGLEQSKGWYPLPGVTPPENTETIITENGIEYLVDFENGQKTGFFLDQKYNRQAVAKLAKGKRVLDCFTHTGSFALNAAKGGAGHVTAVDISEAAIALARENAKRNGLDGLMDFQAANVFDLLPTLENGPERYDFIILDPPAFTKSRKTVESASRGYKEINLRAMKLLPRGGYLATCSCSHFMTDELFRKMLHAAARDAAVQLRQIEARQQAPDHPVLWNVPETDYLKFYLFQVV